PPHPPLFPYTTLFRSTFARGLQVLLRQGDRVVRADARRVRLERPVHADLVALAGELLFQGERRLVQPVFRMPLPAEHRGNLAEEDRKSTRLNSSHVKI